MCIYLIGYNGTSSEELVAFMRNQSADVIQSLKRSKPVIDGVFLTDYPHKLYRAGKFNPIPIISGFTSHEGYGAMKRVLNKRLLMTLTKDNLFNLLTSIIESHFPQDADYISNAVYNQYISPQAEEDMDVLRRDLSTLYSDLFFTAPSMLMAESHSSKDIRVFSHLIILIIYMIG